MKTLHKHDLIGLVLIALVGAVIGWLSTPGFGLSVAVGAATTVTVSEWLSRRRQRKLLPQMEAAAQQVQQYSQTLAQTGHPELAAQAAALSQSAARLQQTTARAREQLF